MMGGCAMAVRGTMEVGCTVAVIAKAVGCSIAVRCAVAVNTIAIG